MIFPAPIGACLVLDRVFLDHQDPPVLWKLQRAGGSQKAQSLGPPSPHNFSASTLTGPAKAGTGTHQNFEGFPVPHRRPAVSAITLLTYHPKSGRAPPRIRATQWGEGEFRTMASSITLGLRLRARHVLSTRSARIIPPRPLSLVTRCPFSTSQNRPAQIKGQTLRALDIMNKSIGHNTPSPKRQQAMKQADGGSEASSAAISIVFPGKYIRPMLSSLNP